MFLIIALIITLLIVYVHEAIYGIIIYIIYIYIYNLLIENVNRIHYNGCLFLPL